MTRRRHGSLSEYAHQPAGADRVNPEAGVIFGVRVLSLSSKNNRRYERSGVEAALGRYQGTPVYCDHPTDPNTGRVQPKRSRMSQDRIGRIENARLSPDGGVVADLRLLKSHPMTPRLLEAAESMPDAFGLSHNIDYEGRQCPETGELIVEHITEVRSVDVVPNPATTKSLFEHEEYPMGDEYEGDDATVTDDYGGAGGTDDLSALDDGKTPEEALAEGYKQACLAVLTQAFDGGLDPAEAKKRLNKFLSDYFKLADPSSSDDGPPPDHTLDDQKDNPMGPQTESRHRRTRGKPLTENQRQRESRRRAGIVAAVTGRKLAKPASPAGSSGSVAESSAPASPDEARRRRIIDRLKGGKSVHRLPE